MADAPERQRPGLRRLPRGLFSNAQLHRVAVGIEDEERLFDRARRRIVGDPLETQLLLLRLGSGGGEIVIGDFKAPDDAF
jgi:hypothetical protein